MFIVVWDGHPVLFPDSAEARQFRGDIVPDLDGGRDQYGAETGGIVNKQLRPRVAAEDRVFHAVPRRGDIEALAVPVEPVGAQVRAPVPADPGDDDVTPLGQERLDLL